MVILAAPAGKNIQYIHIIPATNPVRMHLRTGAVRPMVGSAAGHLFMSSLSAEQFEDEIAALEETQTKIIISQEELMKNVRRIRRQGHAISTNTVTTGGGIGAILLPGDFNGTRLAIGIGGVAQTITSNEQKFVDIMSEAVRRHVNPPNGDRK